MQAMQLSRKSRFNLGMQAGLIAGVIASALMIFLSVFASGVSLPEVFGSKLTELMPLPLFDYLHRLIGADAKHYFFYGILIGQCLVFAVCGGLCNLLAASHPRAYDDEELGQLFWPVGLLLGGLLWLVTGLVFLPLTGAGIFGAQLGIGLVSTLVSLALVGLAYGILFVQIQNWLILRKLRQSQEQDAQTQKAIEITSVSRREALQRAGVLLGVGVLGLLGWRFISGSGGSSSTTSVASSPRLLENFKRKITPPPVPNYGDVRPLPHLSSEITSNDQYYVVSKNLFSDPALNANEWKLTVHGQVAQPFTLTYDELLKLPTKNQYESMMCISNEVGGEYMSSALWQGVPLMDLLNKAGGIQPGATKIVLRAADDYSDSIHLAKALEPTTLLATHMNNEPLPQGHGFPLRLLVPGIYGMKHVKWINTIEVVNTDYQGYWQERGWSDPAPIRMTSRIDTPLAEETLAANQATYIAGVAFSGNQGISEVDVSMDGGKTWQRATLKKPFSQLTWVLWQLAWKPAPGKYTVVVRAVDLQGNVQSPEEAPPLPDGSSGYHSINVTAK